ncbi:head-tail connector protein [Martelella sp. FLE1502]
MTTLIPVLVTPPDEKPVSLEDVKRHLAVDFADDDSLIADLIDGAIAHLDGWRGVLGRAIMPQTWLAKSTCGGRYLLPLPDVTSASVVYGSEDPVSLELETTAGGALVTLTGAGSVEFECALPASQLSVCKVAIMMLVAHWYANRSAVSNVAMEEVPFSAAILINGLRHKRI